MNSKVSTETASKRTKFGNQNFIQSIEWKIAPEHSFTPQSLKAFLIDHEIVINPRKRAVSFLQGVGLWSHILSLTNWMGELPVHSNVKFRIAYIMQDCPTIPRCKVCGNNCAWSDSGFSKWCGIKCRNKDPDLRKQQSETRLKADNNAIQEKRRKTTFEKYGVDHISKVDSLFGHVGQLHAKTMKEKYGDNWAKDFYEKTKAEHGGVHPYGANSSYKSAAEYELIEAFPGLKITHGDRQALYGKEIDVYFSDHKLGIELNGCWWHRENGPNNNRSRYHLNEKRKLAAERGIQIINIWDMEWESRKSQIIAYISSKLGINERIFAKDCAVKEISPAEAKDFINNNHIQPINKEGRIKLAFGLFNCNDELVSVISFGCHPRKGKSNDGVILTRMCAKNNLTVVGGMAKLFNHIIKTNRAESITTWSDNRWSNGNIYKQLGFEIEKKIQPQPMYFDPKKYVIIHKTQARKLGFNSVENATEWEQAQSIGLDRLWDCGKIKWVFKVPSP